MGPIDYILVEWPGRQPTGEAMPHLVDLVDRGLIRILDLTFITKGEDGSVAAVEIADLGGKVPEVAVFAGASSGLIDDDDVAQAGAALAAGTSLSAVASPTVRASAGPSRKNHRSSAMTAAASAKTAMSSSTSTVPRSVRVALRGRCR